ncbi:MAG: rhomboid family intramembrane serine protease [Myxococcota bacterium]
MFAGPRMTPGVKQLMIINVVVFVIYALFRGSSLGWLFEELMLHPPKALFGGRIWQPLTYMFMHASVGHLLGNMLFLFFFGTNVEQMVGTRKTYEIYVLSGLGGALATLIVGGLAAAVVPGSFLGALWLAPHLGASGAIYGITLFWGARLWNQSANFFLLGEMKIRTFVLIIVGIQLLYLISQEGGSSYTAHFGGMAAGFALGRYGIPDLSMFSLRRVRANMKHRETERRLNRFQVIDGDGEGPSDNGDDTAGRPIWLHRPDPKDDDDPIIH